MQIFLFLGVIGMIIFLRIQRDRTIDRLFTEYQNAIQSGNKAEALAAGRAYYAKTRSGFLGLGYGTLTIYDEQAIANDLSVM